MALTDEVVLFSVLSDYLIVMKIQTIVQIIPDTNRYIPHRSGVIPLPTTYNYLITFKILEENR